MSSFAVGNVFLIVSMLLASASQIILKELVELSHSFEWSLAWVRSVATPPRLMRATVAVLMMGGGFLCWLACLTKLQLSYAYPIACTSVFLVTLWSVIFLDEVVTIRSLAGTILIVVGVILLVPSET